MVNAKGSLESLLGSRRKSKAASRGVGRGGEQSAPEERWDDDDFEVVAEGGRYRDSAPASSEGASDDAMTRFLQRR